MSTYDFLSFLQQWLAPLDLPLRWLSLHTYSHHYLLIAAILFWSGLVATGARLAFGTLLSTLVFGSCRHFFASPRPYWAHQELFQGISEKAYGMPSGHSQNATTFWGLLAYSLKHPLAWLIAFVLISLIATSRMYLGVHYPAQVLIGLAIGTLLLVTLSKLEQPTLNYLKLKPLWQRLLITLIFCSLPLIVTLILREVLHIGSGNGSEFPYKRLMFFTGLLSGVGTGLLFISSACHFSIKLLITRAIPGTVSIILLWRLIPGIPTPADNHLLSYVLQWLAGVSLAIWASLVWPWLHRRLFRQ